MEPANACGQASNIVELAWYAFVYVGIPRCGNVGSGLDGYSVIVAAHEMAHSMGALPPGGPPHACPVTTPTAATRAGT